MSHLRTLTGLPPGTLHHFRVASADGRGRQVGSAGGTFATKPPSAGVFRRPPPTTAPVPASQVDSTASAQIAQRAGFPGSFNFVGVIDEAHVFDRALTPAEISTDMSLGR